MSSPFVGEIRMFGGNFAPVGWAFCSGQLQAISENDTLFTLIGTTYGGDGQETFALPNLQGRAPLHQGNGFQLGEQAGTESVTLTVQQMPQHTHLGTGASGNTNVDPTNRLPSPLLQMYNPYDVNSIAPLATATQLVGGNQPHDNMQPYLVITFIISLFGVFPTQS